MLKRMETEFSDAQKRILVTSILWTDSIQNVCDYKKKMQAKIHKENQYDCTEFLIAKMVWALSHEQY